MKTQHDSEVLQAGQQVIVAVCAIYTLADGKYKIFMPKRAATKRFLPDIYELPGGHVDFGETLTDALKREIQEELGVSVTIEEPFAAFTYMNNIKQTHSVEIAYFGQFTSAKPELTLHPEDHSGYIWVSEDEMSQVYTTDKGPDDEEMVVLRKAFSILNARKNALVQ